MKLVRYMGTTPQDFPGGRIVGPDEDPVLVDETHPTVKALFARDLLYEVEEEPKLTGKALERRAKELSIEGYASMTADDLRKAVAKREDELKGGN